MNGTPVDDLAMALDTVAAVVARVPQDQWNAPTPCADWTVREVVNHLALGDHLVADVLRGGPGLAPDAFAPKGADALGDEPAVSYRIAADELLTALRQPDVLDEVFQLPVGTVPGIVAVHVRTVEALVHGWDVARATGQDISFADALVDRELEFSRDAVSQLPPDALPFAPSQPAPDEAPPLDRLVALLGRSLTSP